MTICTSAFLSLGCFLSFQNHGGPGRVSTDISRNAGPMVSRLRGVELYARPSADDLNEGNVYGVSPIFKDRYFKTTDELSRILKRIQTFNEEHPVSTEWVVEYMRMRFTVEDMNVMGDEQLLEFKAEVATLDETDKNAFQQSALVQLKNDQEDASDAFGRFIDLWQTTDDSGRKILKWLVTKFLLPTELHLNARIQDMPFSYWNNRPMHEIPRKNPKIVLPTDFEDNATMQLKLDGVLFIDELLGSLDNDTKLSLYNLYFFGVEFISPSDLKAWAKEHWENNDDEAFYKSGFE